NTICAMVHWKDVIRGRLSARRSICAMPRMWLKPVRIHSCIFSSTAWPKADCRRQSAPEAASRMTEERIAVSLQATGARMDADSYASQGDFFDAAWYLEQMPEAA